MMTDRASWCENSSEMKKTGTLEGSTVWEALLKERDDRSMNNANLDRKSRRVNPGACETVRRRH
jgi:hypothetical protein